MRTGVIAKKMGMTRLFQADGRHVPVTVLQLEDVQVVARREMDRDGYTAVALGAGKAKAKNVANNLRANVTDKVATYAENVVGESIANAAAEPPMGRV